MFEIDPTWADKTFTPPFLSGFLNLVIQYIIKILDNNALITDALPEETKDMWVSATEPLMNFLVEFTDKSPDLYIAHDAFYPILVKYCQENKLRVDSKRRVTILMDKMGYHSTQVRVPGGGRPRVYSGLKWKDDRAPRKDSSLVSPHF
jgi:hypothetical protein